MPVIGFRKNIYRAWLDEAAAHVALRHETDAVRGALDATVRERITSDISRRQTLDILVNIWCKTEKTHPVLHARAIEMFGMASDPDDHLVLHYGLTLLAYPFFREATALVGRTLRFGGAVRTSTLQREMPALIGNLGALFDACARVTFSLRNWGLLVDGDKRYDYVARQPHLKPSTLDLSCWLLAAALTAHPAEALPLADLVRLPELFAFDVALTAREAAAHPLLAVQREASGWDMVRTQVTRDGHALPVPRSPTPHDSGSQ